MCSGIDFVNRIDEILNEQQITRKAFAEKIDILPATMASWKTKNIVPPVDTIITIAKALDVSIEWLLGVEEDFYNTGLLSRIEVRNRIYDSLRTNFNEPEVDEITLHNKYLQKEISYEKLLNWSKGRCNIQFYTIQYIAMAASTNLQYLLTGVNNAPNDFEPLLYKDAVDNRIPLIGLVNINDEKKAIVNNLLDMLMKLEHLEQSSKK